MNNSFDISLVIPSFNEAKRLPEFLRTVTSYCNESSRKYEIIVIDDGSSDNTSEVAKSCLSIYPDTHVIRIDKNRGKGHAVKIGFFSSRGNICVFMDADGSVSPQEIEKNLHYIEGGGYDIFIGSRVCTNEHQVLRVSLIRKVIGSIFNFLVQQFLFKNFKDTQCGFKMFKKEIVERLFSKMHVERFGFDVEILYLANKMGYRIKEGPVSWHHVKGSKINFITDSVSMFANIFQARTRHKHI